MIKNRIFPSSPIYRYIKYWGTYHRILMMEDGYYLEMEITPVNPLMSHGWEDMFDGRRDLLYWTNSSKENVISKTIPAHYITLMRQNLGTNATRLLSGDLWSEIAPYWPTTDVNPSEINLWFANCGNNGGLPLNKLRTFPG